MKIEVQFVRLLVILFYLLSSSLALADSKNEAKKNYDTVITRASRDLACPLDREQTKVEAPLAGRQSGPGGQV